MTPECKESSALTPSKIIMWIVGALFAVAMGAIQFNVNALSANSTKALDLATSHEAQLPYIKENIQDIKDSVNEIRSLLLERKVISKP